jgi:HNH endonuclease
MIVATKCASSLCGKEFLSRKWRSHVPKYCNRICYENGKRTGHTSHQGYRYITVNGKQVLEHRYIMEQNLGRPLRDGKNSEKRETVHHKNGVRNDNRLENLELWVGDHGLGQKVEDLTNHYIEILRKYKPEALAKSE